MCCLTVYQWLQPEACERVLWGAQCLRFSIRFFVRSKHAVARTEPEKACRIFTSAESGDF